MTKELTNEELMNLTEEEIVEDEELDEDKDLEVPDPDLEELEKEEKVEAPKAEPISDGAKYAQLRREARRREQEEAAAKVVAPVQAPQVQIEQNDDPMPDKATDPIGYIDWRDRQRDKELNTIKETFQAIEKEQQQKKLYQDAGQEFRERYAMPLASQIPDLGDALGFLEEQIFEDVAAENPGLSQRELMEKTDQRVVEYAASFKNMGFDPARMLYNLAFSEYGYQRPQQQAVAKETVRAPNLRSIENNRRRSISPANGRGESRSSDLTLEDVGKMSNMELMKLSPEVLQRLEKGA